MPNALYTLDSEIAKYEDKDTPPPPPPPIPWKWLAILFFILFIIASFVIFILLIRPVHLPATATPTTASSTEFPTPMPVAVTITPFQTITVTVTSTPTLTDTATVTALPSDTPLAQPVEALSPTPTNTSTATPTKTLTLTLTPTTTSTATSTPENLAGLLQIELWPELCPFVPKLDNNGVIFDYNYYDLPPLKISLAKTSEPDWELALENRSLVLNRKDGSKRLVLFVTANAKPVNGFFGKVKDDLRSLSYSQCGTQNVLNTYGELIFWLPSYDDPAVTPQGNILHLKSGQSVASNDVTVPIRIGPKVTVKNAYYFPIEENSLDNIILQDGSLTVWCVLKTEDGFYGGWTGAHRRLLWFRKEGKTSGNLTSCASGNYTGSLQVPAVLPTLPVPTPMPTVTLTPTTTPTPTRTPKLTPTP